MTDVLGYISQCGMCGQRAITLAPHKEWACPRCAEVAESSTYEPPAAPVSREVLKEARNAPGNVATRDSVQHSCDICGRTGSRRFTQTAIGWRCSPTATKCTGNKPPSDIPAKPIQAEVTPIQEPADPVQTAPERAHHTNSDITARCTQCPRTWNLTGRVLKSAIDTHEFQKQHIVDVHPQAYAS